MNGVRGLVRLPRLWSVLNVAIPELTIVVGARAVEGRLGDGLFPMYVGNAFHNNHMLK